MNTTERDRGDVMLATTVLVVGLMLAAFALICASQAWAERRNVQGAADAAARAAAQVGADEVRSGLAIDPVAAWARAEVVAAGAGVTLVGVTPVGTDGVTVTVSGAVEYAFPVAAGFPSSMTATGMAVAQVGVVAPGG